jgi:hypothetical protein
MFALGAATTIMNAVVTFVEPAQGDRSKRTGSRSGRRGFEPDGQGGQARMCETFTQRFCRRLPPLVDTRRTSNCSDR